MSFLSASISEYRFILGGEIKCVSSNTIFFFFVPRAKEVLHTESFKMFPRLWNTRQLKHRMYQKIRKQLELSRTIATFSF